MEIGLETVGVLAKESPVFCLYPETFCEDGFKDAGLINLEEEIPARAALGQRHG